MPITSERKAELGNGTSTQIIGKIQANLQFDQFPIYAFHEEIFVLEGSLQVLLLGSPFLNHQNVMIDYRERQLRILDQVLYLIENETTQWKESPGAQLTGKVFLLQDAMMKEACLRRISQIEREFHKLGTTPDITFTFDVTTTTLVAKRPYTVSNKLKAATKMKLKRLAKEGILRKAKCTDYASPAFPILKKNGETAS